MKSIRYRLFRETGEHTYALVDVDVTADHVYTVVGCYPFDDFVDALVSERGFSTQLKSGDKLQIVDLRAAIQVGRVDGQGLAAHDFANELRDARAVLRGKPTSRARFLVALQHFISDEALSSLESLQTAYEEVPEHRRQFLLGDMDRKDGPLRALIVKSISRDQFVAHVRASAEMSWILEAEPDALDSDLANRIRDRTFEGPDED